MRIILLSFVSCLIVACAQIRMPSIDVIYGERQTLYFTGRGAAAGIMMDSFLGGTGVAIGIAIDEGIAKDISVAIQKSNPEFDIRNLVRKQLTIVGGEAALKNWQSLVVEKYGFQIVDGDYVSPVFELTVNCTGGAKVLRFERDSANPDKTEFELIKKDGKVAEGLLWHAVEKTMQVKALSSLCD